MVGKTLAHYEITAQLGAGGMGEVYRARDTHLDRDIALKVLPAGAAKDPDLRRRFESEAKTVAALRHPNIVTIHSIEEADGVRFLTMELVDGRTLSELVPEGGLTLDRFLAIAVPLADAVACAHAKGIAHRDLKPANIMVDAEGRLKVLDFGIAKLWAADPVDPADPERTVAGQTSMTAKGVVIGTPAYMAPEQIGGGAVDTRADLFSLGIVMHELLTGRHPFAADYPAAVMVRIVNDEAPRLREAPEAIVDLVAGCLRKSPGDRPASASDLCAALRGMTGVTGTTGSTLGGASAGAAAASGVRRALDRQDWEEAYRELHSVAERRDLSVEELEMLSEALGWLSRYDEWMETLEKAHAAYAEAGRNRDAGRVALELVAGCVQMHKPAACRGWMKRAERLLADEPECLEQGLLLRRQTVDAMVACDLDCALEVNRRCAEIAERTGDPDLQVVALHDRGQILVARGEIEPGMELIDEAMAAATGGDVNPMTLGSMFCRTMALCRSTADFDRAREWTESASRWGDAYVASAFPGICRVHSAETMRHHGQWQDAERAVREACRFFGRVGPPSHAGDALNELGELALRKGDWDEAEEAFRQAHEFGHDPVPGLPLLRLARGNPAAALQMIERALGECCGDRLRRAELLTAHITIALANDEQAKAEAAIEELTEISASFACPMFRAHAAMGRGAVALARSDPAATPALLEAWSTFREGGFGYDAARARVLLARAYRMTGDEEDASLHLEAARNTFSELGARPDLEAVSELIGRR